MHDKKPKVLLVYPGSKIMGFTYPMGLLYVAQALRKVNIDVSIFHMGVDNIKNLKLEEYLFVGISMLTGEMILNGLYVAKLIKNYNSKIPIVLGGVHPSLLPEESLDNDLVDYVVVGEGEKTSQELAACLLTNQDCSLIKGLGYKNSNKQIIINKPRDFINMDELDFDIPYELLGKYFHEPVLIPVHTSRGCPFRCGFCYNPVVHKRKYRYKSPEKVIEEIEYLNKKYNARFFGFDFEDEFFIYPERVIKILEYILSKGLQIEWTAFCRFNTFDKAYDKLGADFTKIIKKSGCRYLAFGAESGSQRVLDEIIKKDITVDQVIRTVERLKDATIKHRVSFICGFPTETLNELNDTFHLINKISFNNHYIVIGLFTLVPLPGTTIYDLLKKEYDFISPTSLKDWGNYKMPNNSFRNLTWLPTGYARTCANLSLVAKYPFYKDFKSYKKYREFIADVDTTYGRGPADYFMAKVQRRRFKNKNFKFMIEAIIFNKILNARSFLKGYLLRKLLPQKVYVFFRERLGRNTRFKN